MMANMKIFALLEEYEHLSIIASFKRKEDEYVMKLRYCLGPHCNEDFIITLQEARSSYD